MSDSPEIGEEREARKEQGLIETKALPAEISEEEARKIEKIVMAGDFGALTIAQRTNYVQMLCKSLGISWHTQPFIWIVLNGKLTLYATKNCSDQLRATRKISVQIMERAQVGDVFVVRARAIMPDGREDEALGAVSIRNKGGEDLANLFMRAETKAKHRVTKSICGLSFLDESEVQDIPKEKSQINNGPRRILPAPVSVNAGSVKMDKIEAPIEAEYVDLGTGEVLEEKPTNIPPSTRLPPPAQRIIKRS